MLPPLQTTYNRDEPITAQKDEWSCSGHAVRWALRSLRLHPTARQVDLRLKRDGLLDENGLIDHTGLALSHWVTTQFAPFHIWSFVRTMVTWDEMVGEAGLSPTLIYGHAWAHWSGVRDYDPMTDLLVLANPSRYWKGVDQTLSQEQCATLGPWNMVVIGRD